MTEATAGLHMSGMTRMLISGFRIQIASTVPESTKTRAKNTASPWRASVLISAVDAASASVMLYSPSGRAEVGDGLGQREFLLAMLGVPSRTGLRSSSMRPW